VWEDRWRVSILPCVRLDGLQTFLERIGAALAEVFPPGAVLVNVAMPAPWHDPNVVAITYDVRTGCDRDVLTRAHVLAAKGLEWRRA
jgi:hypothetical protein